MTRYEENSKDMRLIIEMNCDDDFAGDVESAAVSFVDFVSSGLLVYPSPPVLFFSSFVWLQFLLELVDLEDQEYTA